MASMASMSLSTASRREVPLSDLDSPILERRMQAIRKLKNESIGNRRRKNDLVEAGALGALASRLRSSRDPPGPEEEEQLLRVLGSLLLGDCVTEEEVESHGLRDLFFKALGGADDRVAYTAASSLSAVLQRERGCWGWFEPRPGARAAPVARLCALLRVATAPMGAVADVSAAAARGDPGLAQLFLAEDAPALMASLLTRHGTSPARPALLRALAALLEACVLSGAHVDTGSADSLLCPDTRAMLLLFARAASEPDIAFFAAACLSFWCALLGECEAVARVRTCLLPAVVSLLDIDVDCHTPPASTLRSLLDADPGLVPTAVDLDVVARLTALLLDRRFQSSPSQGAALSVLAMVSRNSEAQRRSISESGALSELPRWLESSDASKQRGAAELTRSLTRSSQLLRGALAAPELAPALLELTATREDGALALAAAGSLANMVIEDSRVRGLVLEAGGLARFVGMATEQGPDAAQRRLLGLWALSSLAFRSDPPLKRAIIASLPWQTVRAAAVEEQGDEALAEKAWLLLRNLVHAAGDSFEEILTWAREPRLLDLARRAVSSAGLGAKARLHAVYAIVNIASGPPEHKALLLDQGWAAVLVGLLDGEATAMLGGGDQLREAAIWALINLAWGHESDAEVNNRVARIRDVGVESALRALGPGTSQAVLERAQQALEKFKLEPLLGRRAAGAAPEWEGSGLAAMES